MQGGGLGASAPWGEGGHVAAGGLSRAVGRQPQQQQPREEVRRQPPLQRAVPQLSTGPFLRVLELLPAQDQACSGRLVCRDAWRHLSGVQHRTAHLSQPLPPHAVPWFERYGPEALKQLSFEEKLTRPLDAAAASGSTANLAAVWGLVRQGLHPELLLDGCYRYYVCGAEAALVQEGQAHLLPWFLSSSYPVDTKAALRATARHCDLHGLQAAWGLLRPTLDWFEWNQVVAQAAASCATDDAVTKMDWLLQQQVHGLQEPLIDMPVAQAAVQTGDMVRLRWLLQHGCDFQVLPDVGARVRGESALPDAMEHAGLEVVEWLVREAGCQLPDPAAAGADDQNPWPQGPASRKDLVCAAAVSGDCGKLQWLRDRGLLPPDDPQLLGHAAKMAARYGRVGALRFLQPLPPAAVPGALQEAAAEGHLEALRYLHEECGVGLSPHVAAAAVRSENTGVAAWVLQQGFADHSEELWRAAAYSGSVDMVRWLVGEGFMGGGSVADKVEAAVHLVAAGNWCFGKQKKPLDALLQAIKVVFGEASTPHSGGSGGSGIGGSGGEGSGSGDIGGVGAAGATGQLKALAEKVLVAAAGHGSLPLFTYLHNQLQLQLQGPLGPSVLLEATRSGCEALVESLLGHGCGLPEDTLQLFHSPTWRGDLATLRCLRRMGVPWPQALLPTAVRHACHVAMMQWLVAGGAPLDVAAVEREAEAEPGPEWDDYISYRKFMVWLQGLRVKAKA